MKSKKTILAGISALLVLRFVNPAAAISPTTAREWLGHYYENPRPELFVTAVSELSRSGYFEEPGNVPLAIGFMAGVFAQNPGQVDQWMEACSMLPKSHRRLVASALWYSGNPKGPGYLEAFSKVVDPEFQAGIGQLLAMKPSLSETGVRSASSLNLQWGAFLATGEAHYIRNALAALGSDEPGLNSTVRIALAERAVAHQRVYDICQAELSKQPVAAGEQLRAALVEAKSRP